MSTLDIQRFGVLEACQSMVDLDNCTGNAFSTEGVITLLEMAIANVFVTVIDGEYSGDDRVSLIATRLHAGKYTLDEAIKQFRELK